MRILSLFNDDRLGNRLPVVVESGMEGKPTWYGDMLRELRDGNIYGAVSRAKLYKLNASGESQDDTLFGELLESFKWNILRYLERSLDDHDFEGFEQIDHVINRLRNMGIDWKELDTFWDDHKPRVMRLLLRTITMQDEDAGYYTWQEINALRSAHVRWPELDTVMKSALAVMAEKDKISEAAGRIKGSRAIPLGNGDTIPNPAYGPGEPTYSGDPEGYVFKDSRAKEEYDMIKASLQKAGKKLKYLGASKSTQQGRDSFVATAPGLVWVYLVGERLGDLKDMVYVKGVPVKTSRLKWEWTGLVSMDRTLAGDKIDALWSKSRTPDTFLSNLHKLKLDDKKFRKVADRYKQEFILYIIGMLSTFNSYNNKPADSVISYLTKRGVKWPELDIGWIAEKTIPKLIKILKTSITDNLSGKHSMGHPTEHIRNIMARYGHDEVSRNVLSSAMSGISKDLEVFFINYMIKSPYSMDDAQRMIEELEELGIVKIGPFENFAGEIEARKDHVMRMLLVQIRDNKYKHDLKYVSLAIDNLRKAGIDWPEFAAIEKSIRAQTAVASGGQA